MKDYSELYREIARSEQFRESYHGKALGEMSPVDDIDDGYSEAGVCSEEQI